MLELLIKLKYGLTIDKSRQQQEPCPRCGQVICGVKENEDDVFCVNGLCTFHDQINHSHYSWMMERISRDASYNIPILFNDNYRYPNCRIPVMLNKDFKEGRFIIRDLRVDEKRYALYAPKGLDRIDCIDPNSPIIAQYYSLLLLVKDGWISNHDRRIE